MLKEAFLQGRNSIRLVLEAALPRVKPWKAMNTQLYHQTVWKNVRSHLQPGMLRPKAPGAMQPSPSAL